MATLVLNAPRWRSRLENAKSFEETLQTRKGDGYAIARNLFIQLIRPCKVILLCKDRRRRAEGELVELKTTVKTRNGIQRYDVHMRNLREVRYKPERLNRNGVNVLAN